MIRVFYILLLIFIPSLVFSQQFSGVIILEDRNSFYLNQVFVTNLSQQKTILADGAGKFSLRANEGDILRFTSIITERKDIRVTKKHLENTENIISLSITYFDIGEVTLSSFKPTNNLKKDVLSLKVNDKVNTLKQAIGLPTPKGNGLPTDSSPMKFADGGLSFNINAIYDIITGERKKKERLERYRVMMTSIEQIKQYYGEGYFKSLGIPENLINNFLQFVYSSEDITAYLLEKNFEAIKITMEKFLPIYKNRLKNSRLLDLKLG